MSVIRALAIVSLAAGAVLATPEPILACSCHTGGPVCEAFWKTPVVFVGRVEAITPLQPVPESASRQTVRFRVTEALRGTTAREIDIVNYGTSCHFSFARGEQWVVYAFPQEHGDGLTTHTCTRTAPLGEAAVDVAYARASRAFKAEKGRIFGDVRYSHRNGDIVVPRARITLESEGSAPLSALTDARGRYEILAPIGRYQLRALLPRGMTLRPEDRRVELSDNRGCARADVHADYPGKVAGRVVDASRKPVPNLTVELINIDGFEFAPYQLRAVTDAAGRYTIAGVEPGSYAPGVVTGRTDAGNGFRPLYLFNGATTTKRAARRIDVEGGVQQNAGDLIVPEATRIAQIIGIVVHADGQPAAGVKVRTKAASEDNFPWTTIRTDSRGGFAFALVNGMSYRLVVEREDGIGSGTELTLEPSQMSSPLRLQLPRRVR